MRVVISSSGRFHMFDMARELSYHDILYRLIADYPRWKVKQFGLPGSKVHPLWIIGTLGFALRRNSGHLPELLRVIFFRNYHTLFGYRSSSILPSSFDFFIGGSSFSLESIKQCRLRGIPAAVDHGSFHMVIEKKILMEEAARWNLPMPKDLVANWVIDRENEEFELADYVLSLSDSAKRSLISGGVAEKKIFVNPCGVDVRGFIKGSKTEPGFRVLHVGIISLRKGVLDLAQAYSLAGINDAELEFVGGGLESSGLQKLINKLANSRVRFTPPVPQNQLIKRYHQASVFVLASLADGFGMVVTQAMACGLPVIVSENVGAADLIQDGVNGFVVPIRSPEIIADKLRFLKDNPVAAIQMGECARETVQEGFSWQDYGNRLAVFLTNSQNSYDRD
jgi:glycosyltransferase involved in cell wall biosynthesis